MTQGALAAALGVGQQTVSKWETGATIPRPRVLRAVADHLDVSVSTLLVLAGYLDRPPAGSGSPPLPQELDELQREDPEAYELVLEMARTALARVRQRRR